MTELDRQLAQLAVLINSLSRRSQAAIFWVASTVHSESVHPRSREQERECKAMLEAQDAAYDFCLGGSLVARSVTLLEGLDGPLPKDAVAQSAWVCADAAIRVAADDTFEPGMSVEYALEPVLGRVSEELFGVWQVGSGDVEDGQVAEIMTHPDVVGAVEFFGWAVGELAARDAPSPAVLVDIRSRAVVLAGGRSSP